VGGEAGADGGREETRVRREGVEGGGGEQKGRGGKDDRRGDKIGNK